MQGKIFPKEMLNTFGCIDQLIFEDDHHEYFTYEVCIGDIKDKFYQ